MTPHLLSARDIQFLLYELLETNEVLSRPRYQEHSREIFDATLATASTIADKYFANHYAKGDANEPTFDGEKVHQIPETKAAWNAVADAGFMAAHQDFDEGGMQLPTVICAMANAYFTAANIASSGYAFLTIGACNLIRSFGNAEQKSRFMPAMMDGRFTGTMALTEPDQGSALADITTVAEPIAVDSKHNDTDPLLAKAYRIKGQKMFISNGDHSLTENIIHLVLAKIKGAPAGVKGISLFIVPKVMVNADGSLGERNDVALAGLLHKMGYRNATSTALNFGEKTGAIGYLLGEPHQGLAYMFQMMNEARIGVGSGAAVLAYRGYLHALDYARQRPQGRLPSNKNQASKQLAIIEHADVRRMLLAQKAYAEGALALCLYASSLVEDELTGETEQLRDEASALLDLLTPIVKTWPSKYGCASNDLAIQVHGGAGYIREYPVEQLYRDQRLNPIHEGTDGIQGLDLLGRKVNSRQGMGLRLFQQAVAECISDARARPATIALAEVLSDAMQRLQAVTESLQVDIQQDVDRGLANATLYLDFFGRIVIAWIWLRQALVADSALQNASLNDTEQYFYRGKLQAARYYMDCELIQTKYQSELLLDNNLVSFDMRDEWYTQ